jgi:Na+-transporting NADH:ubiquinone oxidoreductase subunit A
MSQIIQFSKGFDIGISGTANQKVHQIDQPDTFAVKPSDFRGIVQPKILVSVGDNVKAGTPLFFDKAMEKVLFVSPVSGEITEIIRGARRKLLEIRILADKEIEFKQFKQFSKSDIAKCSRKEIVEIIAESGIWPSIIQRPFGVLANPTEEPSSIHISGFDSHPGAPDIAFLLKEQGEEFQVGLNILNKLSKGIVHLNLNADEEIASFFIKTQNVKISKFSGPHPAGNVGVQIHHLTPINKRDIVWTIDPVSVARMGKLFLNGQYDASKLVALTGSSVVEPRYVKTYAGACLNKLLVGNVAGNNNRFISGNVLTGENVGENGYLGHFHNQVSVIPEGDTEEFLGWMLPSFKKVSFHKAFGLLSFLFSSKENIIDTNTNGEQRNFAITGAFEKVLPMDIMPTYLFKAIIANDYDAMEALGIFELIEEDVALCEYIDVSKNDIQAILRKGIELIRNS